MVVRGGAGVPPAAPPLIAQPRQQRFQNLRPFPLRMLVGLAAPCRSSGTAFPPVRRIVRADHSQRVRGDGQSGRNRSRPAAALRPATAASAASTAATRPGAAGTGRQFRPRRRQRYRIYYLGPRAGGERVQLLRELVPKRSRVALLWNPANPALFDFYQQVRAAAAVLGLTLQPVVEVRHVTAVNGPTGRSGPSRCARVRRRFA